MHLDAFLKMEDLEKDFDILLPEGQLVWDLCQKPIDIRSMASVCHTAMIVATRTFYTDMEVQWHNNPGVYSRRIQLSASDLQALNQRIMAHSGSQVKKIIQEVIWNAFRHMHDEWGVRVLSGDLCVNVIEKYPHQRFKVSRFWGDVKIDCDWRYMHTERTLLHQDLLFLLHGIRMKHSRVWVPDPVDFAKSVVQDHLLNFLPKSVIGIVWSYMHNSPMGHTGINKRKRIQ